jgi:hypothetical protein
MLGVGIKRFEDRVRIEPGCSPVVRLMTIHISGEAIVRLDRKEAATERTAS